MHWCHNETMMLLMAVPFIGFLARWVRAWLARRRLSKSEDTHV